MKKYQIKLTNTKTKKTTLTTSIFTNRKKAEEWCEKWINLGEPFYAEVVVINK